jgi:hypothetical protein
MKFAILIIVCAFFLNVFAQSKKEQIEILTLRIDSISDNLKNEKLNFSTQIDSLKNNLRIENQIHLNQSTKIMELSDGIINLNDQIDSLNKSLRNLESKFLKVENELIKIKGIKDSLFMLNEKLSSIQLDEKSLKIEYLPIKFWNVTIGQSDSSFIANYVKIKKKQGMFSKLGSYVSSSNSIGGSISAEGKTNLDNILTYNCDEIDFCLDKNNICYKVEIRYYSNIENLQNLFSVMVSDMEKLFNTTANLSINTDINDDKTQVARIRKNDVTLNISKSKYNAKISIYCNEKK